MVRTSACVDALSVLGHVERRLGLRRRRDRTRVEVHPELVVRAGTTAGDLPPAVAQLVESVQGLGAPMDAAVVSEVVRLGRFHGADPVRARAFVLGGGPPTTVKLIRAPSGRRPGMTRELRARRVVADVAPDLAPTIVGHGHDRWRRVSWLHEEVVDGRHLTQRSQVTGVAPTLLQSLRRLYVGSEIAHVPFSRVVDHRTVDRWAAVTVSIPELRTVDLPVRALLAADRDVAVALAHGDVVASNIVTPPGRGPILLDWEFATRRPLTDDAAKLLLQAADRPDVLDATHETLTDLAGPATTSYSLTEQLALSHVRMLTWHLHRRRRAAAAGRSEQLEHDLQRRIDLVTRLLAAAAI